MPCTAISIEYFDHGRDSANKLYAIQPKNYGKGSCPCQYSGPKGGDGLIQKYGINMTRQAIRERAMDMGWLKYS